MPVRPMETDDGETLEGMPIDLYNEPEFESTLFKRILLSPRQFLAADDLAFVSLAEQAVNLLSEDEYKRIVKAMDIKITDFQVDETYICSLSPESRFNLIENTKLPDSVDKQFQGCVMLSDDEVRDLMLNHIKHFKAPAKEIQHAVGLLLSEED